MVDLSCERALTVVLQDWKVGQREDGCEKNFCLHNSLHLVDNAVISCRTYTVAVCTHIQTFDCRDGKQPAGTDKGLGIGHSWDWSVISGVYFVAYIHLGFLLAGPNRTSGRGLACAVQRDDF